MTKEEIDKFANAIIEKIYEQNELQRKILDNLKGQNNLLTERCSNLQKELMEVANARAVVLKEGTSNKGSSVELLSNCNFESEILNRIKNTKFEFLISLNRPFYFDKYVVIDGETYYRNKWCEDIKHELNRLSVQCEYKKKELDELGKQIYILESRKKEILDIKEDIVMPSSSETFTSKLINLFSKRK